MFQSTPALQTPGPTQLFQSTPRVRSVTAFQSTPRAPRAANCRLANCSAVYHLLEPLRERPALARTIDSDQPEHSANSFRANSLAAARKVWPKPAASGSRANRALNQNEIYGPDRTYYVTITPAREFAALLSSWSADHPPREVELQDS